jgi:nucleotide-binding universal stress UspA family protein
VDSSVDEILTRGRESGPLVLGAFVSLLLFLFAVQLLGASTAAAAAPLERFFRRYVAGSGRALGANWLATYVLTNGSVIAALSVSLFKTGILTASRLFPDASITVLHVIDYIEESDTAKALVGDETLRERARDRSAKLLAQAEATAAEYDREVQTAIEVGKSTDEILEYAETHDIDVIVTGSHGRSGVSRILLGSVAETVMRRATSPVTVVR